MKSRTLTLITAMTVFVAISAVPVRLAAQERPAGQTQNPVPLINQPLVPDAVKPGGKGFKLTVNGTGFVSSSVVNWNSSARATTFVSGSQLTASIMASDIAKADTASVTVVNPSPGGGTSNVAFFEATIPISSISLALSEYYTGLGELSVGVGDFNADGKSDLAVTNYSPSGAVSVLLGNGDGTFQPYVDYGTGTTPESVAVGDFNRDGKLDLVTANADSNNISVLLGNGDGTFQAAVDYRTGTRPWAVAVGDFNGDGKLDLVVANLNSNLVSVLLGNGDGIFQAHMDYGTGSGPVSVVVGDFNEDGKLDLVTANAGSNNISILLGNGDGTFQPQVDFGTGNGPDSVAVGDFNGDAKLDLVTSNRGSNDVSVLLGNGDGTFQPRVDYGVGEFLFGVAVADLNGDGKLDMLVTAGSANANVSVLLGNGDGTFQPHVDYKFKTPGISVSVAVGDFNQDGRLDLAEANNSVNVVSVLLQSTTVALSPTKLTFSNQLVGTTSAPKKVTLTNTGDAVALTISNIAITGNDIGDFSQKNNCDSRLPPKAHCTINVTFKPTRFGPRAAAVAITDNAPGSPQSVPVGGIGATSGPNATLSTKSLTFATQLVGTTSPAQPVTLSNYGTMKLDITSIVASGDFSKKDNCGLNLPPGGFCTIDVTFAPTQRGHRTGTVSITDNAPNSPQKVHLRGTGTVVKLDPTNLDFGTVKLGQKSSPQATTLTNTGRTPLHITNITIKGTNAGDFSQQHNCPDPGYLGAGKSCTITVTFQPTQVGSRNADVSVSDDGGDSPQQVGLSGTGTCGTSCPCPSGCSCVFNRCRPASFTPSKETASRQTCSQINPFTELR